MAKVKVKLFASVREAAGRAGGELEASNLAELVESMKSRYGPSLAGMLAGRERDPESVVILVNGRNVGRTPYGAVRLSDGDEVAVFPPVSGG